MDAGVRLGGRWRPKVGNGRTPVSGEPETRVRYAGDSVNDFRPGIFCPSNDLAQHPRQAVSGEAAHQGASADRRGLARAIRS